MNKRLYFAVMIGVFLNLGLTAQASNRVQAEFSAGLLGLSGVSSLSSPVLMSYGLGGSYLIPFGETSFGWGASSELNIARQVTGTSSAGGVYSGMRWNILAPTVSYQFGSWLLTAEFEFLGNYTFSTKSLTGSTISYRSPLGEKFKILKEFQTSWSGGLEYETLSFGSKNGNALVNREGYWQIAVLLAYSI